MIPIAHNSRSEIKKCTSCGEEKPGSYHYFYFDRKTGGHQDVCKDCKKLTSGRKRNSLEDVLNKYDIDSNGCWIYNGSSLSSGYGVFYYQSAGLMAHRISYQLLVGEIPDGLVLDHLCRNKLCINPEHLEPVKQGENARRWFKGYKHCETCSCEGGD